MAFFDREFATFFEGLARNNHKEWFHANKSTYEKKVKGPFYAFVNEMITRIGDSDPRVRLEVKNAVFRINRDIRFSKDKSPYKNHIAAVISPSGRRCMSDPGLYFHFSAKGATLAAGCYRPDKADLSRIRRHVVQHAAGLEAILANKALQSKWGELRGEKNKILPREFKQVAQNIPVLFNKQYYIMTELPPESLLRRDLAAHLMRHWSAARPLNDYLGDALGGG